MEREELHSTEGFGRRGGSRFTGFIPTQYPMTRQPDLSSTPTDSLAMHL